MTDIRNVAGFRCVAPGELGDNVFRLISKDWFLLTAGDMSTGFNTMTASWGGLGHLWNKDVSFVFVRPQRYTWKFTEDNSLYTMSIFTGDHRSALEFCGTHSGRDTDKPAETGLTPFHPCEGATAFREARLVMICRKLYHQDIDPSLFLNPELDELYPEKGYHRMYVGEITGVLQAT